MAKKFKLEKAQAMEDFGKMMAGSLPAGTVIYLEGELGAGKTTFVRGFLRGLDYSDHVRSPTYNLFEVYDAGGKTICHLDLYRLKEPDEVLYFGVLDYFDDKNICLIEWPEKGEGFLPNADIFCKFDFTDNQDERVVDVIGISSHGEEIVSKLNLT